MMNWRIWTVFLLAAALFAGCAQKDEPTKEEATHADPNTVVNVDGEPKEGDAKEGEIKKASPDAPPQDQDLLTKGADRLDLSGFYNANKDNKGAMVVAMQMGPFEASGFPAMIVENLPPEERKVYDTFLAEAKWDPVKEIEGFAILAEDSRFDKLFKEGHTSAVLVLKNTIPSTLIDYIRENDTDESDGEASGDKGFIAIQAPLSAEQVKSVAGLLFNKEAGEPKVIELDATHLLVIADKGDGVTGWGYVYAQGMVVGDWKRAEGDDLEAIARTHANKALNKLDAVAKASAAKKGEAPALYVAGEVQGNPFKVSLGLGDNFSLEVEAKVPDAELKKVQPLFDNLENFKKDPSALLGKAPLPPGLKPIAELFLKNINGSLDGNQAKVQVIIPMDDLKGALPQK